MNEPFFCFSRVPSAVVRQQVDGHIYANIPHCLEDGKIVTDYDNPRLLRADDARCFVKGGERYVWFATVGSALVKRVCPPFGVSVLTAKNALAASNGEAFTESPVIE